MSSDRVDWPDPAAIMTFLDGDPDEDPWVTPRLQTEEIPLEAYSEEWPIRFEALRRQIADALPETVIQIEHIGSTSVPGLESKPVIDIDLIVPDPTCEQAYVPALTALGYVLTIRERSWYEHRMLRLHMPRVNLHIFGPQCPEHARHLLFRDWLCAHPEDQQRYAQAKHQSRDCSVNMVEYNQNKQAVIRDIYRRIFEHHSWQ